jgi:hypothetical protein
MPSTNKVLAVVTNVGEYEKVGYRTGLWLGELTHFWDVAEKAGYPADVPTRLAGRGGGLAARGAREGVRG